MAAVKIWIKHVSYFVTLCHGFFKLFRFMFVSNYSQLCNEVSLVMLRGLILQVNIGFGLEDNLFILMIHLVWMIICSF